LQIALSAYRNGDQAAALDALAEAITNDPQRPDLYSTRGLCLLDLHRQSDAEADFRRALELDASHWTARYGLGMLAVQRGELPTAQSYLLDGAGQFSGPLLVIRDASRESMLRQFTEEIVDMVIHDVRSPLTGIVSSLRLVEDMVSTGDTDDVAEVVDIALTNGNTQLRLIETLVELREMELGRRIIHLTPVALPFVVEGVVPNRQSQAAEHDVRLRNLIPRDLPPVLGDEPLLARVIGQLLDNALRHTPSGGEIRIESRVLRPDGGDLTFVELSVTDTGHGVPQAMRELVFGKFYQVPRSALRGRRGPGLGLTFCRHVMQAIGGRIWVDDGPEGGARFAFVLPAASDSAAAVGKSA
jgi:signal transduction histidine kinase